MLGRRRADTSGTPSLTTLPQGTWRRGRPRSAPPACPGWAGPGQDHPPVPLQRPEEPGGASLPRRHTQASGLGRNRSSQPATTAASPPTACPNRGASKLPSNPPASPVTTMTATRQGKLRVQAAHSAARIRRQFACAEPPGRPTLARPRPSTTGRSSPARASNSSGSSPRWARMAWRSAWLSGRTDPLGRSSSSSKGHGCGLLIGVPLLLVLASGPLRPLPATLLTSSRWVGAH
jgi:hypothetical protein